MEKKVAKLDAELVKYKDQMKKMREGPAKVKFHRFDSSNPFKNQARVFKSGLMEEMDTFRIVSDQVNDGLMDHLIGAWLVD